MPKLINAVAVDFDKLFKNSDFAARTFDCIIYRIMIMTIHLPFMLVIRIFRTEDNTTHRTCKVFYMVLLV